MTLAADRLAAAGRPLRPGGLVLPLWPALWGSLLLVALALRLGALDAVPLAPDEAARALEARAIWRGPPASYTAPPLLVNLMAIWFGLFTAADGPARAPSALAGWALCLTPLLFRSRLGTPGAFAAGALLSASPLVVLASRSVHPAALATLGLAAAVGCVVRAYDRADGRWLVGSGLAVGLGLGAGAAFVGQAAAFVIALAICPPLAAKPGFPLRAWLPRAAAAGMGAAFVCDTLLLTRPNGFQAGLIDPFVDWLGSIGPSFASPIAAGLLGLHELPLVACAGWGLIGAWRCPFGRFLAVWALLAGLLAVLQRTPDLGPLVAWTLPLALLGGLGLARLAWLWQARRPAVWLTASILLVPFVFLVLATNNGLNRGGGLSFAPFAIAAGGLVAAALFTSTWLSRAEAGAALGLALALGLLLPEATLMTRLNYVGFERAGPFLGGQSSRADLRLVEARVADWWRQSPAEPLQVDASLRPLLAWTLRDGPPIDWITVAPGSADRTILGGGVSGQPPNGAWVRLVIGERYVPLTEPPGPSALWRWLAFRQSLVRSEPRAILITR